ncbi:MAG: response regulator transcription factor [Clostridiales bacterium]|nr:response regulator transcription factor [Clostridiales bacterium]
MKTIAITDDDPNIAELMRLYLEKENYRVLVYNSGFELYQALFKTHIDLIVLDIMMPGLTGFELLETYLNGRIPVIIVSAKGTLDDKLKGLQNGADDYLVKPFEGPELVARVEAVLRRYKGYERIKPLNFPNLVIDLEKYEVVYRGESICLPQKEISLLYHLARHINQVFTREQLMESIWGKDYDSDYRTVDVHIKRLRSRFKYDEIWCIKTVWGVGYKFEMKDMT